MSIAPEFDQSYRTQLITELEKKLSFEETMIPRLSWAMLWFADLDRLQELIDNPDTVSAKSMFLYPEPFEDLLAFPDDLESTSTSTKRDHPDSEEQPSPSERPKLDEDNDSGKWPSAEPLDTCEAGENAADQCSVRDDNRCFVTKAGQPADATYIAQVPTAQSDPFFWEMLSHCVSKYKLNAWKKAVEQGGLAERCDNLLSMSPSVAAYWRDYLFALKPIELSEDSTSMKVQFFWLPAPPLDMEYITSRPDLPEDLGTPGDDIKLWDCRIERKIVSGHIITLVTDDPEERPLPSWYLLEMDWFLRRLSVLAGLMGYVDGELEDYEDDSSYTTGRSTSCGIWNMLKSLDNY
ncbi:uncharacterized protein ASPGLDRAFT_81141 [Aspergillus glaucus CBS 516.65]|uniref:HNH nuclease domain-containing protein n=1 Tax=Aspergillus glaucus CBS 516.65 TaxID=1160497 RepID=A0A1L9VN93_ASPGL|nr:hypothetical protein ASPGLDRAFT_81141 [Aspergillus glaucus CBS 516.65]OJJ85397.1 hypothetical protein ASPGLDRAFT_81141 [Aspergillus glaucus CBS 516.65]